MKTGQKKQRNTFLNLLWMFSNNTQTLIKFGKIFFFPRDDDDKDDGGNDFIFLNVNFK